MIAHVIGATVEGYVVRDETAYLLLDIGFIWNIYLSGEMGLVPHPVFVNELDANDIVKGELRADIDALLRRDLHPVLNWFEAPTVASPLQSVEFLALENSRRLILNCDGGSLVVETSLDTAEVKVYES